MSRVQNVQSPNVQSPNVQSPNVQSPNVQSINMYPKLKILNFYQICFESKRLRAKNQIPSKISNHSANVLHSKLCYNSSRNDLQDDFKSKQREIQRSCCRLFLCLNVTVLVFTLFTIDLQARTSLNQISDSRVLQCTVGQN